MIERAAKQILQVGGFDESDQTMAFARLYARTVMKAMRDPTWDMCQAAVRTEKRLDEGDVEVNYIVVAFDIWPKMIDAALSSEQEK